MSEPILVRRATYAGLFLVSLATLMYEMLLTRIFSVTMWYHFAFLAVSVALFGMTVGAIGVYLAPAFFTPERVRRQLAGSAALFALTTPVSFLAHLAFPLGKPGLPAILSMGLTYVAFAIPFTFSGICICLIMTRLAHQVSRLYMADLAGAAGGGLLLIATLAITDGPTAVMVAALLAGLAAAFFAVDAGARRLLVLAGVLVVGLASFVVVNTVLQAQQRPLLRFSWVKGQPEEQPLYQKWNSFSRITVTGDPDRSQPFREWSVSPAAPPYNVGQLFIAIDSAAQTSMIDFHGDWANLEYLKYDISHLAYHIRPDARVVVVGAGGGRDVLAALVGGGRSVVAIELNGAIIDTVNRQFGDFTGHLDRDPRVTFVEDEARSYLARQQAQYDVIQVSLIDTWAATAAGAFVLTENSLYTVEAWQIFLQRLSPDGLLTFTRWYLNDDNPAEIYRLVSLATTTLQRQGVSNPRDHLILVRLALADRPAGAPAGMGTLLVSKEPFTAADIATIEAVARQCEFEVMLTPQTAADANLATIADGGKGLAAFVAGFPLNISAPTDDSPFFFHMLRLRDIVQPDLWAEGWQSFNSKAVLILGVLLIVVLVLTLLCIVIPLLLTTRRGMLHGGWPLFVFFAGIGVGYMLIELSQMQRLIVFLGHPTYSLSVVLSTLLLASGLGSLSTQRVRDAARRGSLLRLGLLLVVLVLFGALTPQVVVLLQGAATPVRIAAAVAILFPLGFLMGMAFPLGLKLATARSAALTPWLWGINGAMSVCASVLSVVIAITWGISASFWTGFAAYVVAGLAFVVAAWGVRDARMVS